MDMNWMVPMVVGLFEAPKKAMLLWLAMGYRGLSTMDGMLFMVSCLDDSFNNEISLNRWGEQYYEGRQAVKEEGRTFLRSDNKNRLGLLLPSQSSSETVGFVYEEEKGMQNRFCKYRMER